MDTTVISKAVEQAGGQTALAAAIGVSQQMVWQWVNGRRPVPAKYCIAIEQTPGVTQTRYDLRPDVFGASPDAKAA